MRSDASNVAELFNVQTRRETKTVFARSRLNHFRFCPKFFLSSGLRHQPDVVCSDLWKLSQIGNDIINIVDGVDYKLQD